MAAAIKQQRTVAKISTTQLDYVLQERRLLNVLDYVLSNVYEQNIKNDTRAEAYNQLELVRAAEKTNLLKEDFCAMFGSGNVGLVSEDDPLCSKRVAKSDKKEAETTINMSTSQNRGFYKPAKTPYTLKVKNQTYTITLWPSSAFPNLNTINKRALVGYLYYLGLSKENALQLAGTIKDWIDGDDFTDDRGGAEWSDYSQTNRPYKPRNGPIKNWQELNHLLRVSPDLVALLRQNFVLQGAEKVDDTYMSNTQIAALSGVKQSIVDSWQLQKTQKNHTVELDSKAIKKIDNVAGKTLAVDDIVIKITSGKNQIMAWFNIKERKLQDWSLSQDLPNSLPVKTNITENYDELFAF